MKYKEEIKKIRAGNTKPVYLIDTDEEFFREEFFSTVKEHFFSSSEINVITFRAETQNCEEIVQEAGSSSLFAAQKIIRVKDAFYFLEKMTGWFTDFLVQAYQDETSLTVLFMEDDLSSYRNKSQKKVIRALKELSKNHDYIVDVPSVKKYRVAGWLCKRAKTSHGLTLYKSEAEQIVENVGHNLMQLDNELEKISLFINPRTRVTREDIEELILFNRENTIFELLDALSSSNTSQALLYLNKLVNLRSGNEIYVIRMIYWHLKRLIHSKLMRDQGIGDKDIAKSLNIHPYYRDKFFHQAGSFSFDQLNFLMKQASETDMLAKSGHDSKNILEQFVLRFITGNQQTILT